MIFDVLVQQDKTNKFSTRFDPRPYLVTARQGCLLVLERNGKHLKRNVAHCKIIPNYNRREMIKSDINGEDIDDINDRVIQNRNTLPPGTCAIVPDVTKTQQTTTQVFFIVRLVRVAKGFTNPDLDRFTGIPLFLILYF